MTYSPYRRISVTIDITELSGRNEHRIEVREAVHGSDDQVRDRLADLMAQAADSLPVHDAKVVDE